MPPISRWFARASLIYLLLGLILSLLIALRAVMPLPIFIAKLGPATIHILLAGWVTQLIFAVMLWMFPVYSKERPRGSDALSWIAFGLLNSGLLLRLIAEPLNALSGSSLWDIGLAVSALLQVPAAIALVANIWPRVRGR